jgi:hypothetical protein
VLLRFTMLHMVRHICCGQRRSDHGAICSVDGRLPSAP